MRDGSGSALEGAETSSRATVPARLCAGAVRTYQLVLSPVIGPACRYDPTCSQYAIEALERHGAVRGLWLAARRIGRCHPLGGFGYDPVP